MSGCSASRAKRTRSTVNETRYSVAGVPSGPFVAAGTGIERCPFRTREHFSSRSIDRRAWRSWRFLAVHAARRDVARTFGRVLQPARVCSLDGFAHHVGARVRVSCAPHADLE